MVPLAGVYATPGRQYRMSLIGAAVGAVAAAAWAVAGWLSMIELETPLPFFLALVVAAVTTIPLITVALNRRYLPPAIVRAARKHVYAYMAGVLDSEQGGGPGGGSRSTPVEDEPEPPALRAV